MKIVTRDVPTPKKGEMLIKVAASAINRPDVMQVQSNVFLIISSVWECILLQKELVIFLVSNVQVLWLL